MYTTPLVFDTHLDDDYPRPIPLRHAYFVASLPFPDFMNLLLDPMERVVGRDRIYLHAFDCASGEERCPVPARYYTDIHPQATLGPARPLLEMLAELPATHFVWSPDLEDGLFRYRCDTIGMPTYDGEWVPKWDVDLQEAAELIRQTVAECNRAVNARKGTTLLSSSPASGTENLTDALKIGPIGSTTEALLVAEASLTQEKVETLGPAHPVPPVTELSKRELGKEKTAALHKKWGEASNELRKQPPPRGHHKWTRVLISQEIAKRPIGEGYAPEYIRRWMKRE